MAKKRTSPVADQLNVGPVVEKMVDPKIATDSVVDYPSVGEMNKPGIMPIFLLASMANKILPWGSDVAARDMQLRAFYPTEPVLLSAIYSVAARDASFAWEIVPTDPRVDSKNTRMAVTRMLESSGLGIGWVRFMSKTCLSLYTQDNGAFWELIRKEDRPDSPVINLNLLDSARCTRTGNPAVPVIYQDRNGKYHELKAHHVVTIEEMPSDIEEMYGVQMCAVTRALRLAQILLSILVYKDEKISGRNPRAIDVVSGLTNTQITDAIKLAEEVANNKGFARFINHVIVGSIDPTHVVSHERIDLASLPDNFNFDEEMKWYVALLAMAFGVDYQEFAPLPSGAMGSGAQSEILHLKTHGKGPATIMEIFTHILNSYVLPKNVRFKFKDHDARTEGAKADARYTRARDRSLRVTSGEIDGKAARDMAVADGDLPDWIAEEVTQREEEMQRKMEEQMQAQQDQQNQPGQEMNSSGQQIAGAQQGQMRGDNMRTRPNPAGQGGMTGQKDYPRGGMRGVKPLSAPVPVTQDDIKRQREEILRTLEMG